MQQLSPAWVDTGPMHRLANLPPPHTLTPEDARWPPGLSALKDPPCELQVCGQLPSLVGAIAVVGTRASDTLANRFARSLGRAAAEAGLCVVSGGARGIDSEAHAGALEAGGSTVAVLANYFDAPYPRANWPLFERIVESGALLTEAPGPRAPRAHHFLNRNRIIAAITSMTVVVQAPVRSGALSTAAHARDLERPILVVPGAPWDPRAGGCLRLLAAGARICTGVEDVLSIAPPGAVPGGPGTPSPGPKPQEDPRFDDDQRAVLRALTAGPGDPDQLCGQTGLSAERIQRAVLMLLLSNAIEEAGSGRYVTAD